MRVQKPVMWGFRAAPCFLAHEEPNVPATQRVTQSFCSHYIMESALICWCLVGIAGSSPYPYPRIRRKTQIYKMPWPAGSDAHDFVFYRHLAVVYLALWGEKRSEKWILWLTGLQTRAWQGAPVESRKWFFFTAMHLCSYCFMASFGLADWGHVLMTFSITAHSIKTCKVVLN